MTDSEPAGFETGSTVGPYRIEGRIGQGGMGVVYRATHLTLGRPVALKVVRPDVAADEQFRDRFRRECQAAVAFEHPHAVTIYDAGEDRGRLYVAMRYVDGPNLAQILDVEGPLDPARAVSIIEHVGAALAAAHARGLLHRDVKPANVLVERGPDGESASLGDFGLARRIGDDDPGLTGEVGWVGTVDYVAPEQVRGETLDPRTDVYGLGCVLFTALTGRVPFDHPNAAAKLYACVNEPPPRPSSIRPGLPPELDAVVGRAMTKDPAQRFAAVGELVSAARAAVQAPTSSPEARSRQTGGRRSRRPIALAGVATTAAVGLLVGLLLAFTLGGGRGPAQSAASSHHQNGKPSTVGSSGAGPSSSGTATDVGSGSAGGGGTTPISVKVVTDDGATSTYRVSLYDVRRSGPFAFLDFTLKCADRSCDTGIGLSGKGNSFETASGIALVDRQGQSRLSAVTDLDGHPLASKLPFSLDSGAAPLAAWVAYPAPSPKARAMDVIFPNGGPEISGVPVTSTAPSFPAGTTPAQRATFDLPPGDTNTQLMKLPVDELTSAKPTESSAASSNTETVSLSSDVLFDFDKATLTQAARGILSGVAAQIKQSGTGTVTVTGYTDSIGPDSVNIPLSQARAQSVVNALTPLVAGAPVTFSGSGQGAANPVAPNTKPDGSDNPAGRALNRRVIISYAVTAPVQSVTVTGPAPTQPAGPSTVRFTETQQSSNGDQNTYGVSFQSLVRQGPYAVLDLSVTCLNHDGATTNASCDGADDLGASYDVPPLPIDQEGGPASNDGWSSANGFYLQDASGNDYIAVNDGAPLGSLTSDTFAKSWSTGQANSVWIYFPAPAPTVHTIDVMMPGGHVKITGVPITEGRAR